jgi:membrane-bound acyltransferase YfiQ involved in biofilm formation
MILFGGAATPFYFVPLLCQLYVVSPYLVSMARSRPIWLLLATACLQLAVIGLRYGQIDGASPAIPGHAVSLLSSGWFFPSHVFWFSFGIAAGFHLSHFRDLLLRLRWFMLASALAAAVLGVFEWEFLLRQSGETWLRPQVTLGDSAYSFLALLAFMGFTGSSAPSAGVIREIGSHSFGIYLIHAPVQEFVARALYHLVPMVLAHQILLQPALIIIGVGVPLLLITAIRRSPASRLQHVLFG